MHWHSFWYGEQIWALINIKKIDYYADDLAKFKQYVLIIKKIASKNHEKITHN